MIGRRLPAGVRRALNPVRAELRVGLAAASALVGRIGPLPHYLVIGAQRSGTTWLHELMIAHPDVVAPRTKEVHYFDRHWHRGPDWYRANFAPAAAEARRRGPAGVRVCTGEATPYTLFHPLGASRVAATVPDARLVVVLRDPTARAWSHWRHARHLGVERESFATALALEDQRLAGAEEQLTSKPRAWHRSHQYHSYVARGRYVVQLARWLEHFERDRLLVVWFDDLVDGPAPTLSRVATHLGTAPFATGPDRWPAVDPGPPLDTALAAELRARFDDDDRALAELVGDVPPWRRRVG